MGQILHMKFLTCSLFVLVSLISSALASEHVILTGGPALRKWENYRTELDRHDRWWANFVRASTMQMDNLRKEYGADSTITWYVYRSGYTLRGREDGKPYTSWIQEQASKRDVRLVWISSGSDFIRGFNGLPAKRVKTFDFFGHSNKHCFLLDYSSQLLGATSAWLHETELSRLSRRPLAPKAICKSWGCHTGESMSKYWKRSLGVPLVGAKGKTDYTALSKGRMPAINGRWTR